MYKVFINNKRIIFHHQALQNHIILPPLPLSELPKYVLHKSEDNFVLIDENAEQIFEEFQQNFNIIAAAGGIVISNKNQVLCIERFDIPDLPKGKVESNESIPTAALREVMEETNLQHPEIVHALPDTWHMYQLKGQWVIKPTYWFLMQAQQQALKPQTEEAISQAYWIPQEDIQEHFKASYRSLYELILEVFPSNE